MEKSSILVKHALSGDEANLHSCCRLKYDYFKPKCHKTLHNCQLLVVPVQRTAETSFKVMMSI